MSSSVEFKWNTKGVVNEVEKRVESRLNDVGAFLKSKIVRSISTPTRGSGPSRPGEPPHADTGRLRQSVFSQIDRPGLRVILGVTVKYGVYLELGTTKMEARPFLRPALTRYQSQIRNILTR